MKIKDLVFKCERFSIPDYDGFTGVLNVEYKNGFFIKGIKYCSRCSPEHEYSKQTAKKELIEFCKKYEKEILEQCG